MTSINQNHGVLTLHGIAKKIPTNKLLGHLGVNILSFLSVFYTSEVLVDIYVLARNDMRVASLIFCEMNFYVLKIH